MMKRLALVLVLLAGCSITRRIEPVSRPIEGPLCVKENPNVLHKEFLEVLCAEFERHGVRTWVYQDERPPDCRYHATYTAHWRWDMATYLRFAEIDVFDDDETIGHALYDATTGIGSLRKFGATRGKVRGLVDDLMRDVERRS